MITIDIIDENNERPTRPAIQTGPAGKTHRHGNFDAAYESASSLHSDLLNRAQQERNASQAEESSSFDAADILNRIARALTAWL